MKGLNAKPVRIEDEETGEWIEIKAQFSRGDVDDLNDALMEMVVSNNADNTQSTQAKVRSMRRITMLLEHAIVGWHLLDEKGDDWKYSPNRVRLLPQESPLVDKVLEQIVELNPTLGANRL
jgi:hypothetical protein